MLWKIQKLLQKLQIITYVNQFAEPQYHLNWSQAKIPKISNSQFSSLYSQKKTCPYQGFCLQLVLVS